PRTSRRERQEPRNDGPASALQTRLIEPGTTTQRAAGTRERPVLVHGALNTYTPEDDTYLEEAVKRKLTVTIDKEIVPRAKRYARQRGVSLSQLIERALVSLSPQEE